VNIDSSSAIYSKKSWYCSKKSTDKAIFAPFVNERDGAGRLLPIFTLKNKPGRIKESKFAQMTALASHSKEKKSTIVKQRGMSFHAKYPDLKKYLKTFVTIGNCKLTKNKFFDELSLHENPTNTRTSNLANELNQSNAGSFIQSKQKRIPNYSFSKSKKKTIIEETIEKSKNNDLEYIDVSKAHEVLNKHHTYIPDYSKIGKSGNTDNLRVNINHGYLMKILNSHERENQARFIKRKHRFIHKHEAA
jgi:hypothetical protein